MTRTPSRRKLSSVRLTRKYHLRFSGRWVGISLVNIVLLAVMASVIYGNVKDFLLPPEMAGTAEATRFHLLLKLGFGAAVGIYVLAILAVAVLSAHRLAGPYLAVIRTCKQIGGGDYGHRLRFRSYDHLEEVEQAFNAMLDALNARAIPGGKGKEAQTEARKASPALNLV